MKTIVTPARSAIAAVLLIGMALPAQAQSLRSALDQGEQATRKAERVQEQINQLDDERTDMVREYRTLLQRRDAAELYARQQELVVASQRQEIDSLTEQLGSIDDITAQTVPMLLSMIEDLKLFVSNDLPFKKDIRQTRLDNLDAIMASADVSRAEQYRLIMDAYQAEMEYGSTMDTWKEEITIDSNPVTVDMVLFGRVAYVYVEPNGKTARWNRASGEWEPLPSSYNAPLKAAVRIVQGKAQQNVMYAPVKKMAVQ